MKLKRVFQGFIIPQTNILNDQLKERACNTNTDYCGEVNPTTEKFCYHSNKIKFYSLLTFLKIIKKFHFFLGIGSICEHQDTCGGENNLWNCTRRFFNDGVLRKSLQSIELGKQELNICPAVS